MQEKVVFFMFRRDLGTFIHILLYAKEILASGNEVKIVLEDKATALLFELSDPSRLSSAVFEELIPKGIVVVCRACAVKTEAIVIAENKKIPVVGDLNGHVSMFTFIKEGYRIISL